MICDDIIYLLFLHCDDIETLINLSKVCKTFFLISKSLIIKEKLKKLSRIRVNVLLLDNDNDINFCYYNYNYNNIFDYIFKIFKVNNYLLSIEFIEKDYIEQYEVSKYEDKIYKFRWFSTQSLNPTHKIFSQSIVCQS